MFVLRNQLLKKVHSMSLRFTLPRHSDIWALENVVATGFIEIFHLVKRNNIWDFLKCGDCHHLSRNRTANCELRSQFGTYESAHHWLIINITHRTVSPHSLAQVLYTASFFFLSFSSLSRWHQQETGASGGPRKPWTLQLCEEIFCGPPSVELAADCECRAPTVLSPLSSGRGAENVSGPHFHPNYTGYPAGLVSVTFVTKTWEVQIKIYLLTVSRMLLFVLMLTELHDFRCMQKNYDWFMRN